MTQTKTQRPNWEKNGSLMESTHMIPALLVAREIDPMAFVEERTLSPVTIQIITNKLNRMYPTVKFIPGSVRLYINGVITDTAVIGTTGRWSTNPKIRKELKHLRQMLSNTLRLI